MGKIGILLHVYNVEDAGWEHITWGRPDSNELGCLPKLCQLLLTESHDVPIAEIIVFSGPSTKDGLTEGEYTKKFLLNNLAKLEEFSALKPLLEKEAGWYKTLHAHFENIVVGKNLARTSDEIATAATELQYPEIRHVIQIACASHAPRCIQQQTLSRSQGLLPQDQIWSVVASDTFFVDSGPDDTVIFEKPHLGYDPMFNVAPSAPEVLRRYFGLPPIAKKAFLQIAEGFMKKQEQQNKR